MLLGWNGATTMSADLATDIEVARQAGFAGIELNAVKLKKYLEQHSAAELGERLEASKLRPLNITAIERVTYAGEQWERIERDYRQTSRIAGELGCEMLIVCPGQRPSGVTDSEVKEETISVLEALADIASGDGVKLGFEFQSWVACSVRTLGLAWEIISELDRPDTGLVLDAFHFHAGGSPLASLRQLKAPRLFLFQASDCENLPLAKLQPQARLLPGATGVIPLGKMWHELNAIGYDGPVTVEAPNPLHAQRNPAEVAAEAHQALLNIFGPAANKKA
jgi:2-keto-myo-inositol isomerase